MIKDVLRVPTAFFRLVVVALVVGASGAIAGGSPTITVDPANISATGTTGSSTPVVRPLTISNVGGSTLTWSEGIVRVHERGTPEVVWNQPRSGNASIVSAFSTTHNGGSYTAADFVLSADTILTEIKTFGLDSGGTLPTQPSITWAIYLDAGDQPAGNPETDPGPAVWSYSSPPSGAGVSIAGVGEITLNLALAGQHLDLPPSAYWLTVFPSYNNAITGNPRWNWYQANVAGTGSMAIAPTLFGNITEWTLTGPGGLNTPIEDVAFTLTGIQGVVECGAPWLSIEPTSGSVEAGQSQGISVMLDASALDEGVYATNLCIDSNDPDHPTTAVPVVFAVDADHDLPGMSLQPASLIFGGVLVGDSAAPRTVTLASTGGSPLTVDAIDEALAPFARTGGTCPATPFTVAPGQDCTLSYGFAPTESGPFEQAIAIASNAAPASVPLRGSGLPRAAEAVGLLPDTGQTRCYALDNAEVPCDEAHTGDHSPLPRQDARYGRDAATALGLLPKIGGGEHGFDFTRICASGDIEGEGTCPLSPPMPANLENPGTNDWACVRDNLTGLTWTLGNPVRATWTEASTTDEGGYIHRANASARCGLASGWRLPANREGFTIAHLGRRLPAVDPAYFPVMVAHATDGTSFWTSDVDAGTPVLNHVLLYEAGNPGGYGQCREAVPGTLCASPPPPTGRWESSVLLVNGEWRSATPSGRGDRWEIRDDGLIIADTATGLVWDRCTWGQLDADCEGDAVLYPVWNDAMQVAQIANQQHYKGYDDWRLPNARELQTLVKIDAFNPAIDSNVFPNTPPNHFWTSSSSWLSQPTVGNRVWSVGFREGLVARSTKIQTQPDRGWIRLVRGGDPWGAFDSLKAELTASPTSLDFGAVTVGGSTHPRTVTLTSTSGQPVEIDAIDEASAPFARTGGDCPAAPFTLEPGESCTLDYTFAPTATGPFDQTLVITSNVDPVEITLTGQGADALLSVQPGAIDFGQVEVGGAATPTAVTVTSNGNLPVEVSGIDAAAEPFSRTGGNCPAAPFTLAPTESCTLEYGFTPTAAGAFDQTLTITSTADPVSFELAGTGIAPALSVQPSTLDFGDVQVGNSTTVQTVTVTSAGDAPLSVTAIDAAAAPFARTGGDCPATPFILAPGANCTLTYNFAPTAVGTFEQTIAFASNGGSAAVALLGAGLPLPPQIDVDPEQLDFELETGNSASETVLIGNAGQAPLEWSVRTDTLAGPTGLLRSLDQGALIDTTENRQGADVERLGRSSTGPIFLVRDPVATRRGDGATVTHSNVPDQIVSPNTVACGVQGQPFTRANQFLRSFTLTDFGIDTGFDVEEVRFAVEVLSVAQAITVNLYTLDGALAYANLDLLATATVELSPQTTQFVTVPISTSVPAGATLVMEVAVPDLNGIGRFYAGSNNLGETAPSYLAAANCNLGEPATYASIGFPQVHLLMSVSGRAATDCALPPWLSLDPESGTVAGGAVGETELTVDALDLSAGSHAAALCIESNDPARPLVTLPVDVQVSEGDSADLGLSLSSMPGTVAAGGELVLLAAVANFGPAEATHVTVELALPDAFTFVSGRVVHGAGNWQCSAVDALVSCDLVAGTLPVGSVAASLQVQVAVAAHAAAGPITTTGSVVSSNAVDPNSGNDTASVVTHIVAGPPDGIFTHDFECASGIDGCSTGGEPGVYSDRAAFLAQVTGGHHEEDFAGVPVGEAGPSLDFSGNGFAWTVSAPLELYNAPGVVSHNNSGDVLTITFTGDPVTAVGGNWWATDKGFGATGSQIVLTLSDGTVETYSPTGPAGFRGFVTELPIASLTIDAPSVPVAQWAAIDNVIVGAR